MTTQFKFRGDMPSSEVRAKADTLAKKLDIPNFMARIMVARGICDPVEAQMFMNPSLDRDWRNPYEIDGLYDAVNVLESAIKQRKKIVVYGDFDVDGITSTTVMTRVIRGLGGTALPFIPSRFDEGYGLSKEALARVRDLKGDVLVTVDCGISCKEEVRLAQDEGLEVVVTDHHEVGSNVPEGVPIVDPKAQPDCPSAILAGVGVALKVVQALGSRCGQPHLWREYTDFAALGTIADLMPLIDENRALVSDGIKKMRKNPRPCIAALAAVSGTSTESITSTSLSFSLIPRINAAGRMNDVELALRLMLTDDYKSATFLAEELNVLNDKRREIESDLSVVATDLALRDYSKDRAIVVAGKGWHEGVKGIVASKLTGTFGVPSLMFSIEGDVARGSGRSVGNVNLFKAVESASSLLTKFGGHSAAVGVTLPVANLDAFRQAMNDYMQTLPDEEFVSKCEIDALVDLEELDLESVKQLDRLAPFGNKNPQPMLLARSVMLENCRAVGADKTHLSCELSDGVASVKGIMFRCKGIEDLLKNSSIVDAAFNVQIDEWRGRYSVKANLQDIAVSKSCSALEHCVDADTRTYMDGLFMCENGRRSMSGGGSGASERTRSEGSSDAKRTRDDWHKLANEDASALESCVIEALIGNGDLHRSQKDAIRLLDKGKSLLAVMGTGRGKSLIFQVHAAKTALKDGKCSLFIYPLRALMADQAFHMQEKFARFDLTCKVLNGYTSQKERKDIYRAIADGRVDIVLTTPEYLSFHAKEISRVGKIGFAVIDEAHHIGQAKAGTRPAYKELHRSLKMLGNPQVLAVTATADRNVANEISDELGLTDIIVDDSARVNLQLDDKRGLSSRDDYLAHIASSGDKCVIYVNSRDQSIALARQLRMQLPHLAPLIGFYNAGLSREDRARVEDLFRKGVIRTLVATSAFGEGIDIPDIRHVVLYHMPFSDIEFNQMSGRAGRDGASSTVHLLFGKKDAQINRSILLRLAPDRDTMATIYRYLKRMQKAVPGCFMDFDFARLAREIDPSRSSIDEEMIDCAIRVFTELGLIDAQKMPTLSSVECSIKVVDVSSKVELCDSTLYSEGTDEMCSFDMFKDWVLKGDAGLLRDRIIHPISPTE